MKVMIIEDEPSNERHLRRLLEKVLPDAETVISTDSVRSSIDFLSRNRFLPDLVFADIQLSDGMRSLMQDMSNGKAVYLRRLLLERGPEMFPAEVRDICFLESDFRAVAVYLADGRHGMVNHPLRYFEDVLDPGHFIRVSRRHIIAPSRVECFRKAGPGRCEAVFPSPVDRVVEFPLEKLGAIRRIYEISD